MITFCYAKPYKMLTIRVDKETKSMTAYLRLHKVRWQPEAKQLIKDLLTEKCKEFKRKESRIKDAPIWVYE
jgi:hypothetical protein